MRLSTIILLAASACLATAQISAPRVGIARYANGTVRAVYGLDANFIIGEQAIPPADAISFSDSGGLVARAGHLQLLGRNRSVLAEYETGESAPLLNIDGDLTTAIAWLPSRHVLLHWNGKAFIVTPLTSALFENVTSLRVQTAKSAKLLLATTDNNVLEATVSLESGEIVSMNPLPGVRAPAFEQYSFIVFHDEKGIEIESPSGVIRTLPLPAPDLTFERMSSDALHLASAATRQDWVLHLNANFLKLSQLPAPRETGK